MSTNTGDIRGQMLRTLDRVVADTLTVAEREAADGGGMSDKLWSALTSQGMTELGEAGSEISFADAMALIERAAYHAAPVPLGETIFARRLLSRAGLKVPEGALTLAVQNGAPASRRLGGVAFARAVPHAVAAEGGNIHLFDIGAAVTRQAHNQAGEPRDEIDLGKAKPLASAPLPYAARRLRTEGALLRAVQLSGALERTLVHSLSWVNDRVQFGKPIARFQAIQHAMAVMASEVAAAKAAVDMAVEMSGEEADWFAVAVAKSRAGEAAGKVAAAAHAAFGAIGFTREHLLHYSTRRLWAWRDEFGSEVDWQAELGRHVAEKGGAKLWETLTAQG